MKRTTAALLAVVSMCASAHADSERVTHAVLADYFTRYYCNLRRPESTPAIVEAFNASKLKHITVQCEELKCNNPDHSEGLQRLLSRAETLSEEELSEVCASYSENLFHVERELSDELASANTRSPNKAIESAPAGRPTRKGREPLLAAHRWRSARTT